MIIGQILGKPGRSRFEDKGVMIGRKKGGSRKEDRWVKMTQRLYGAAVVDVLTSRTRVGCSSRWRRRSGGVIAVASPTTTTTSWDDDHHWVNAKVTSCKTCCRRGHCGGSRTCSTPEHAHTHTSVHARQTTPPHVYGCMYALATKALL